LIVKKREIPEKIRALEAILRRIASNHPKRLLIESDLSKYRAGFNGEQALDYYLSFLDEQEFTIFHDLRLKHGEYYFQIDCLLLTAYFALIIEVKNMTGTLRFEPNFNQLIRSLNDKEEGFPNPIFQIKRQKLQLENWLNKQHFQGTPIEILIVYSNSTAVLIGNKVVSSIVCKVDRVLEKINELERMHTNQNLNEKEIKKLTKLLLKNHTSSNKSSYLQKYTIPHTDIITGVQCPQCSTIPMSYYRKKWYCPACQIESIDAHIQAINDYFYLIDQSISNKELRQFLHITSINSTSKLLATMDLVKSGEKKGRVYSPRY